MEESDLQKLYELAQRLDGDAGKALERLRGLVGRYAREVPKGLREPRVLLERWLTEDAKGAPFLDGAQVRPLTEEELARLEGLLEGMRLRSRVEGELAGHGKAPAVLLGRPTPWYQRVGTPLQRGIVAVVLLLGALWFSMRNSAPTVEELMMEMIHLYHNPPAQLPVADFEAVRLDARDKLVGLGFEPKAPAIVEDSPNWQPVGIGKITLLGGPALLVSFSEKSRPQKQVLFESRIPKDLDLKDLKAAPSGEGLEARVDAVVLRVWLEKELLMGLVGPP